METFFASYPQYEYAIAAIQLVLVRLGLGATLTPNDFIQVARHSRSLGTGMVIQLVIVPAIAFGLCRAVAIEPGLAVGLALMASVPVGTFRLRLNPRQQSSPSPAELVLHLSGPTRFVASSLGQDNTRRPGSERSATGLRRTRERERARQRERPRARERDRAPGCG